MTIVDQVISELNALGYLNNGFVSKNEIETIREKYKYVEEDLKDKCFVSGFHDGFRSETGIPTPIITPTKKNNLI